MVNHEILKENSLTKNEKIILDEIINDWVDIKTKDIKVKELQNWLIAISSKWQIFAYRYLEDGQIKNYLNIRDWIVQDPLFYDMIRYTWYRYINNKLYKNEDVVLWRPKEWSKEIDIFSQEFFKVMDDTSFYSDLFSNSEFIRRAEKWETWVLTEQEMNLNFERWNFRLKDFLYLRQCKMIGDKMYKKYLPIIISKLEGQASDTRYDIFAREWEFWRVEIKWTKLVAVEKSETDITEEEVKYYFENKYINANQAKKIIEIIRIKQKKEEEKKEIKKNTQSNLIQEKSEYNV